MSNVSFLLIVVVISVVGSLFLWLRSRKPTSLMSSIEEFQREMGALARNPHQEPRRVRRPTKLKPIMPSRQGGNIADKFRLARRLRGEADLSFRGGSAYQLERQIDVDWED
ncbi:MAG: hypothetical protein N2037_00850 [Acidimicrobiales bacterium]|nr:hypothetical protein [Acidimicrobiales bacterium]